MIFHFNYLHKSLLDATYPEKTYTYNTIFVLLKDPKIYSFQLRNTIRLRIYKKQ